MCGTKVPSRIPRSISLTADELIRVEIDWFVLTDCEAFVSVRFGGFGITERESSESDVDSLWETVLFNCLVRDFFILFILLSSLEE